MTPQARQARDEILEHLIDGRYVTAVRVYRASSGKPLAESRSVIDRLRQILDKPGSDAADEAFLAEFRASLDNPPRVPQRTPSPATALSPTKKPRRVGTYRGTPEAVPANPADRQTIGGPVRAPMSAPPANEATPPGVGPVLVDVLLMQITTSTLLVGVSLAIGALGYWLSYWLAMLLAMIAGVGLFIVLPGLFDELLDRLGLSRYTRTPSLLFDFALSLSLLAGVIIGGHTAARWLWFQRADVIVLAQPQALADEAGHGAQRIFRLESLHILARPAATYDDHVSRNADRGGSYVDHWHVNAIATQARADPPCLWFGWQTHTGRGGFDDPLSINDPGDHYVIADHDRYYRRAIRTALGGSEPPECTMIINRVPSPDQGRDQMARRLGLLLMLSATLPWLLLLLISAHALVRRFRRMHAPADTA
ncbi:MAG: hypothetical protein R3E83_14210 [Burkholderiaceae bacterium]